MPVGNSYIVNDSTTLVIEGTGGAGQDVVLASVDYALTPGSEIEVLRTTNDRGRSSIDLTGNEFALKRSSAILALMRRHRTWI